MTRWLISVPVWGQHYVDEFCAAALPPLTRAIEALAELPDIEARLIIHTDRAEQVGAATSARVECRPVPAGARGFDCMSQAHREVLRLGLRGDVVVLLTAGAVISAQGLRYCAKVLEDPRLRLVLCAVPRALPRGPLPDAADGESLMRWAWDNRHPMTEECIWPHGRSRDLSRTFYLGADDSVASRQALPHPLAVRIDGRPLRFTPTVDANLIHCFDPSEMHMTPDCRELALIKLSPEDKAFDLVDASMRARAARGELVIADKHQRWCLGHRVHLCGSGEIQDDDHFMVALRG